jgi:O-antigen/teichoic acid export membrane protein
LLGQALDVVLFPAMSRVQEDSARLALAYRRGITAVALVMLPGSAILFVIAPELVRLLLGPQWGAVVVPFQILVIGLLLRTSYKLSDSLARATGAVYRRAWRQAVYAALVAGGAWLGHRSGIAGVAAGVLGAVAVNFLLMAHLSLRMAGMSWGVFARAHREPLALGAAVALIAGSAAAAARTTSMSSAWIVAATAGSAVVGAAALARLAPSVFLGRDGAWMLSLLRTCVPTRLGGARAGRRTLTTHGPTTAGQTP